MGEKKTYKIGKYTLAIPATSPTKVEIADDCLLCPKCGGEHIHHKRVAVFDRLYEDAPTHAILAGQASVSFQTGPWAESNNPSSRRDGVAIKFWCEDCQSLFALTLAQHKGQTLLKWRTEILPE
jgi:hypothetical protein